MGRHYPLAKEGIEGIAAGPFTWVQYGWVGEREGDGGVALTFSLSVEGGRGMSRPFPCVWEG